MATTFFTPVAPVELPATNIGAWTNVVSLDTYATVPANATHVLLETTYTAGTSSPGYGFQNGDDTTNYIYPAKNRFTRFDWVLINTAKTLSLYVNVASTVKFYVRGYSNHIVPVSTLDMSTSVTTNATTTITCSSLPADAAGGAAVFIYNSSLGTFSNVGAGVGLGYYSYIDKQMEVVPLNDLKQFDFRQPTAGGLTANQLVLVGYIPVGRFVGSPNPGAELITPVSTWMDTANVDLTGVYDIWRYRGTSTSDFFGFGTGGSTNGATTLNSKTNPLYIVPNASTGKSTFWSSSIGSTNGAYYVGYFTSSFTDKIIGGTDTISRGAKGTLLRAAGMSSIKSLKIGSLHGDSVVGSGGLFNFNFPNFVNGQTYPAYGSYALAVTDGTSTINGTVNLVPRATETTVTISNVSGVGPGYLQNYVPLAVGDVVTYRTPGSLGVTANSISAAGVIASDYVGVQTLWVRTAATGIMTRVSITTDTLNNTPNIFTFTPVTYSPLSTVTTSNVITVGGLSTTAAISIVNGTFSKNGAAYTSTSTTVTNGDTVSVRITSPAATGLSATTTLTIGLISEEFTVYTTPLWAIPTAFSFTDQTGVGTSSTVTSNTITIAGIESGSSAPISITGGTYSVNGGSYVSTAGTVASGDTVAIRLTASPTVSTAVTATLTIANVSTTWSATTGAGAADVTPDAFSFTAQTAVARSSTIESNTITVAGVDAGQNVPISITGGQYAVNTGSGFGAFTSSPTNVQLGYTVKVNLTSSASFNTAATATLTIGGVSANFVATTLAADLTPDVFTFTDVTGQALSTIVESNSITVAGVDAGQNVPISVTGGEYSVNSGGGFGAFTASAGNVQLGHIVKVRGTSSASNSAAVNVALTIGGVSDTFTITTLAAVDTTPDAFSFTDVTNQVRGATIESNTITVAGVTGSTNVAITITGGEYAINTGGGFGSFTASPGQVQLGHIVKVRGVASASYSTATNVALTIGGVSDTFTITTLASPTNALSSVNSGTVRVSSTGNTATTVSYPSATGFTIGGVSVSGFAGSNNAFTFNIPDFSAGITLPAFGTVTASITDGTTPSNLNISFLPKTTQNYVTLTSTSTAAGFIGSYITCAVGDQIVFPTPASLSVATNTIGVDGSITSDFTGAQTMWHRNGSTGFITQLSVTTAPVDTTPDAFTFTDVTGVIRSTVNESNVITIAGVTSATNVAISVSGGEYAVNTGSGFGAYTGLAGNVQLGHTVKVRGTASGSYNTPVNVVLTVGGVSDTYTITTAAAPTPTLVSINSGSVLANSVGNTIVSSGYTAATGLTIGGVPMISFTGSANSYSFSVPALANGIQYPPLGSTTATLTDGTNAANLNVTFLPKATQGYVTLTSVVVAVGYAGNYVSCTVGDQIIFDLPGTLSVTANGVDVDGRFFSDYSGTQTMYHRNHTTGILTELSVITPAQLAVDTTPDNFTFTSVTGSEYSTNVNSAPTVVAGITAATPVAISITGGTYSKNGGAFTSTAGTVVLGDSIVVRVVSSASATTGVTATLTIGGVTGTFTATTRAVDTVPDAFAFTAVSGGTISTLYTSNGITVAGVDAGIDVPITITGGGQYAINTGGGYGSYTSSPGVVRLGYSVRVQLTSSASGNTTVSSTVNIGTITGVYSVGTGVLDTTPDAYTFTAATALATSTLTESNSVTVAGMTAGVDVAISVTGGEYAINTGGGFGAFTATGGVIQNGYTVKVRGTSSASFATLQAVTLNIGGVPSTFNMTTRAADVTPSAFTFTTSTGNEISTVVTSAAITVAGVDAGIDIPITVTNGVYAINTGSGFGAFTASPGVVRLGHTVQARVVSSGLYSSSSTVTVSIGGINGTFTANTRAADTTPNAFTFTDTVNAELSTQTTSTAITVAGIDPGVDSVVTITGGQYAVNSGSGYGAFTASPGVARLGDTIIVRVTSANTYFSPASATLTVGGVSAAYSVSTRAVDTTPTAFDFTPIVGAVASSVNVSNSITVLGVDAGVDVPISVSGGEYAINSGSGFGSYTTAPGVVRLNDVVRVRVTASAAESTLVSATVSIGGVDGAFLVTTATLIDTTPDAFTFTDQTNVAINATVESNAIDVAGVTIATDVPVSIVGGQYAVDPGTGTFGSFQSTASVVRAGYRVKVSVLTGSAFNTGNSAILTIGGVSDTFTATTRVADTTPAAFSLASSSGIALSTVVLSDMVTVAGVDAGVDIPIIVTNCSYAVNSGSGFGAYTSSPGVVRLGDIVRLRLTASSVVATAITAILTIGGVNANWVVTTQTVLNATPDVPVVTLTNSIYESAPFTISGVDSGSDINISVTNCEYAVNTGSGFGAFTNTAGVVHLNNTVKLRVTVPSTTTGSVTATVTLNTVTTNFVVNQSTGTVQPDTTPDAFTLAAITSAPINALTESNYFTVAGVDAGVDVPVTVGNGTEWAYNRGTGWSAYRTTAGNVRLGDQVRVRVTTSGSLNTAVTGTITVGGVQRSFVVTTIVTADITPDAFSFSHARELEPNEEVTSSVVSVVGIDAGFGISATITGGQYSVNSGNGWGAWLSTSSIVRLGYSVRLKANASKTAGDTATVALTMGGVTGQWQLTTTAKAQKVISAQTSATSFTYPIQPSTQTITDNIIRITQSLVPASVNAAVSARSIWSDVVEIVRFTDYTLSAPPAIDYAGFAYKNLPNLIVAVRNTGTLGNFVGDYQESIAYIVSTCWHDLAQLITAQPDCDVNNVIIRNGVLTLQCSIGR